MRKSNQTPPPPSSQPPLPPPPTTTMATTTRRPTTYETTTTHQNHYTQIPYYHSSSSLKTCCCCLFLLLIFLVLLCLAVILVVVLAVRPKKPQFDLQQVTVQYLLVTSPSSPSTTTAAIAAVSAVPLAYLSLNFTMVFTAVNPNKVGINYGSSGFTVMYKGVPLGSASVPGFFQPAHSARLVQARVAVDRVDVSTADAAGLVRDVALNDRVELNVVGDVGASVRVIDFNSPKVQVSVNCVIVISPRKQSLTYKQCGVDGLNV